MVEEDPIASVSPEKRNVLVGYDKMYLVSK